MLKEMVFIEFLIMSRLLMHCSVCHLGYEAVVIKGLTFAKSWENI